MPGNKEEKEKCLEKLIRMQKYLPFLDFMIDKIKKKNNESSLKCQLSKFQVLRSMIAEKNGKYTWNELIKVEDVIKKLISKLDFKGQYENSRENSPKREKQNYKANMATSNTKAPSSAPTICAADIKPQEISTNTVEFIMKALKVSTDINMRKSAERGQQLFSSSLVLNQPLDVPGKSKETDLAKDLDGFDLTDSESSNSVVEVVSASPSPAPAPVPVPVPASAPVLTPPPAPVPIPASAPVLTPSPVPAPALTHSDLLSSSREKLLKSLQSRLLPSKGDLPSPKPSAVGQSVKTIESQSISASSRSHGVFSEVKGSSDFSESTDNGAVDRGRIKTVDIVDVIPGKPIPTPSKATKPFSLSEKIRSDPSTSVVIDNLKQKLKEKFSTDICELYRVPGKSVGGSLRSLKKVKSRKKSFIEEEDDLFKPDKITEKTDPKRTNVSQSKFFPEKRDNIGNDKNKSGKKDSWKGEASSGKTGDKEGDKSSKSKTQKSESYKYEKSLSKEKKRSFKEDGEGKSLQLDKLNDDELLNFVKENTKSLPHLAKLKPSQLRKAIQTSTVKASLDLDSMSEISDDSFCDFDEKADLESKIKFKSSDNENKSHPLASLKIAQIGADGVAKNIKPITESSKDAKVLDELGDKTHDMDLSEDLDEEEDYAQRLIEETTPRAEPIKPVKKKGLLELPLPIINDLFDDISSIESFETLNSSPTEGFDSKTTLPKFSEKTTTKNKSESIHQPSVDQSSSKPTGGGRSSSFGRDNPQPSKDCSLSARVQTNTGPIPASTENQRSWVPSSLRTNQNRPDPWPSKSLAGHSSQGMTQHPQLSNQHIAEPGGGVLRGHSKPPGNPSVNSLRRHSCGSAEPRSYAEYKRLKQVKSSQHETGAKENAKSITSDSSSAAEISKSPAERDAPDGATRKTKDPHSKQTNPKNHHSGVSYDERRRPLNAGQRRRSDHTDFRKSCEETGKIGEEKRKSTESEELVSPLEKLYENERKPQTGRGYGLQHFKIPKKVREAVSQCPSKPNESHVPLDEPKTSTSSNRSEADSSKDRKEPVCVPIDLENDGALVEERSKKTGEKLAKDNPAEGTEKTESDKTVTKTESNIIESDSTSHEVVDSKAALESNETETARESVPNPEKDVTKSESVKTPSQKCEAQIVECDSSVENPGVCEQNVGKEKTPPGDKSATVSKEEITQEFVEALIRKSFQSGEGKLLLAHAKLFEEFAKKLNSKKLKTIQRIINSETDSSSSSTEVFSEDERKKKKGKKSEERIQKNKRLRKKGRKGKRHKSLSSSSCSSSESEESSEEECSDKKDEKNGKKQRDEAMDDEDSRSQQRSAIDESKSKNPDSVPVKANKRVKKRRRNAEFGKNFNRRKAKRKRQQKKLLEQILNETPEASPDRNASNPKESERKTRTRTKGKVKSELDRLHDDIRNMFLNEGVVTPTGQRMCRILKQSGGNMTNLDIVKESAKMVEEEKLKKAHAVRSYGKKSRGGHADSSDSRSSSQSLDKTSKSLESQQEGEDGVDPKLTMDPRVLLQRVNLSNFGYAVKLSDNCISFKRMRGKNTAIKSMSSQSMHSKVQSEYKLVRNVFLPRNKRKVNRMREAKCKKEYAGKRIADVVKNLPLKMAKMKHLQICEKKKEQPEELKGRKCTSGKSPKRSALWKNKSDLEFSSAELLKHAFEKIRVMYSCKLCSHVTRYITGHYKVAHPDHEVLISRLCLGEAKRAKLEAKKNGYNIAASKGNPIAKRKTTTPNSSNLYNCRMCASMKTEDLEVFKAHVSSHTGEYRFQCPAEECSTKTYSFVDIKIHILTKHGKNRTEYNKVTELYNIVVEEDKMFGFLCSICNYVQLCRDNVAEHFSRWHATTEKAEIIKINMSASPSKAVRRKSEKIDGEKETFKSGENNEKFDEESVGKLKKTGQGGNPEGERENQDDDVNVASPKEKTRVFKNAKVKREEEDEGEDEEVEEEEEEEEEEEAEDEDKMEIEEEEVEVEERKEEVKKKLFNTISEDFSEKSSQEKETGVELPAISREANNAGENCMDLENIPAPETGEIRGSVECSEDGNRGVGVLQKLKVGPLEAQLLVNSSVLYECYVKGCLFFTQTFNLFEKHIKISHCNTEWDGICEICNAGKESPPSGDNSFKLLTALRHLRLHEREKLSDGKFSKEELIRELKLLNSSEECVVDNEETDKTENDAENPLETNEEEQKTTENAEPPFPAKPLLRVRSLLGDRLSTPKESSEENEVVPISETTPPLESQPKSMFTIENVRSLNDAPSEDSEIQIEHVCSLKDSPKPLPPLTPGKTILVRSCPTRKIAIRPETSALSIDVGQLSVVQTPPPTHPVVLAPLTTAAPIRIISSSALSPRPKFTVKPIFVSTDPGRISTSNVLSIIRPTLSPIVPTAPATTEPKTAPQTPVMPESSSANQLLSGSKPLEVKVNSPPPQSKSVPPTPSSTGVVDVENLEENDSASLQKIYPSPNAGNKRVKDAKIYEEMLTKTKLCHLFKCMGIECSFTCNEESVFRQHIGLHEAQRRLKRNKGIRTIFLRLANKMTRAFYWQQCAYCCELLTNTNNALSQHVLEEHGHCMYQCAFCFYRAVSHSYVEIHQNLAHGQVLKTAPRVIYKCKPLRPPPSQVAALIKHGRRQCVRPYHCDQCGRKFFITQDFIKHLTTQHQSVTAYTCHICKNLCFKADRLVVHYKLHSYCTYQCAYCLHGTETEKEMVFHLCNFHFSQPAIMYMRAFADGQSHEVKEKQTKMKKHLKDQLDSLKVIVYESDTLNLDCIVEVDADEETSGNTSDVNMDLSSIVAELGINTDVQSQQSCVTPLMKELASIGDRNTNNLTVKTLLPNAEFSSENENGTENCSVLISSGLSTPTDESNEKAMNIPLGQLPLEAVSVQHKEAINVSSTPDKSLKLSEIIENIHIKDKAVVAVPNPDDKIQPAVISSAIHKLPPVVLSRTSASKNVYSSKSAVVKKKSEEAVQPKENVEGVKIPSSETKEVGRSPGNNKKGTTLGEDSVKTSHSSAAKAGASGANEENEKSLGEPSLISSVVSLSTGAFEKESAGSLSSSSVVISDVGSSGFLLNVQPKVNNPALKPPIIRVEDFPIGEENKEKSVQESPVNPEPEKKDDDEKSVTADGKPPSSPDIIILEEEKPNDIITVTLDSDDEKEENSKKEIDKVVKSEDEVSKSSVGGNVIRKEMELLRNQIANETDSLLFDDEEGEKKKVKKDLSLSIDPGAEQSPTKESLLSPIEEAICSLNKKLQSETEQAQKKEEEIKKESIAEVSPNKGTENSASELPKRPMTRFAARDRRKEGGESGEKSDGDDSSIKKEGPGKCKKIMEDLVGKTLFICGNENCNFAANNDVELKDHLYVCDLSRESSMLVCPHCSRQIKQFHSYLEHLRYHGPKKYHCGLCDYSSAGESSVTRHVKQKHKCSFLKALPKESQPGHMAYYPKNYKVEKVDFEANGYSPGDEDKLPLQSVYQVNVKCAKCPYFTKVRSNMVRHLKIHVKSVETEGVVVVPSTAPTNPVPCLETKERMFDKMTNLAASSQLAQAKEKAVIESLSSEEAAKLPQFIAEQMRYKCCLPDCNYITVDDGMLKHHIKALHDEINYYSCPHCQSTVHVDVRNVTLDKIGHHLKHHDAKLYKCAHCIFFHYQKNVVEKHTAEKHPDRRYFVHIVREPKPETASEEEPSSNESGPRVWKCGLCENYRTPSKPTLRDHLLKNHNIKSKYRCQLCPMKGNSYQAFLSHFSSKHPGEKVSFTKVYLSEKGSLESGNSSGADSSSDHFDTTPLWQRGTPRIRHIRGILIEEEEIKTKKMKRTSVEESEAEKSEEVTVNENAFSCPLCTNKKKPFFTRSEDCFRTHLYQELNYQQFACILCGKMFVDRKDFDRHHARVHPDKSPAVKQTKEDQEIKFWVDQVIAKRRKEMENRKRKLGDGEGSGNAVPPKKKKEV